MKLVSPALSIALLSGERLAVARAHRHRGRYDSVPTNGRRWLQNRSDRAGLDEDGPGPDHSAALDRNDNGIDLDGAEYVYGSVVEGSFAVTTDMVPPDVLAELDVGRMSEWTIGLFMRMQTPVPGEDGEDPIVSVAPSFEGAEAGATISLGSLKDSKRALQDGPDPNAPYDPDDEDEDEAPDMGAALDMANLDLPDLDLSGTFTIPSQSTTAAVLDENKYGLGFDVYLLDEEGRVIAGPATFYMVKTEAMQQAEAAAYAKVSVNLSRDHSVKIHKVAKGNGSGKPGAKSKGASPAKAAGVLAAEGGGPGAGPPPILAAEPLLGDYLLETDKRHYDLGEDVLITYDLSAGTGHRLVRMLQNSWGRSGDAWARGGDASARGGGQNKGGGRDRAGGQDREGRRDRNGRDRDGRGEGAGDSLPDVDVVDPTVVPSIDDPTTTLAPPAGDVALAYDGPDPDDPDDPDDGFIGEAPEEQDEVDVHDVTLYRVGVFMRMAHPQGGSLDPIVYQEVCPGGNCLPEDASSGSVTISTNDLGVGDVNGLGFAVWILNGAGGEVAGPFDFYVNEDSIG